MFFRRRKRIKGQSETAPTFGGQYVLEIRNLSMDIESSPILKNVYVKIPAYSIVSIIGPSGSGKSSLLRAINNTNFTGRSYKYSGEIRYCGLNILNGREISLEYLRTQIGTVLQKPVMFPMSIRENILYALRAHGINSSEKLEIMLEKSLREVNLWDEVKDRLNSNPEETLSIGQQQRLCIARAISLRPKVLLMDEPTSALDIKSSHKIEELIRRFASAKISTIVLVSHSLEQVRRISDYVVFVKGGVVIEQGPTEDIFTRPKEKKTKEFLSSV